MTHWLGTLQLVALALVLFGAALRLVLAALRRLLSAQLLARPHRQRANVLLVWAALPALGALGLVSLCFLPSMEGMAGLGYDHCLSHDDLHAHFCLLHPPHSAGSALGWALLAVCAVVLVARAAEPARRLRAGWQLVSTLLHGSQVQDGLLLVPSETPFSAVAGLLRPVVLLSSGLRDALTAPALEVVLEHEREHARHRDGARLLLVEIFSLLHTQSERRWLREAHALACEQACDQAAAEHLGDRLQVAEVILRAERLLAHAPTTLLGLPSIGGGSVASRVEALLSDAPRPASPSPWPWVAAAVLAVLAANPLHSLTESLLGLLGR